MKRTPPHKGTGRHSHRHHEEKGMEGMIENLTRRQFVGAGAIAAGLGLAGCSSSSSKDSSSSSSTSASGSGALRGSSADEYDADLVKAAKEEGSLVVYGCCEEPYISAACDKYTEIFGIQTSWQRLSTGEVLAKIEEENGSPSADIWFAGTTDPYNVASTENLLETYKATNASHIMSDKYTSTDNTWVGIYKGILGFLTNTEDLDDKKLDAPADWPDLLDSGYNGLIWSSNYSTSGTAKLILNTCVQKYGHDDGIKYLVDLDKNIAQYTKAGGGPSKSIGTGECTIGIGMLHDGIYQIVDNGYDNIGLVVPSSGASYEVGATAVIKGAAHPNAAKLWLEYCLTPTCVNQAAGTGSYQFLVIDDAKQPDVAEEFGLDPNNVMDYDFEDAKQNTTQYVDDLMAALEAAGENTSDTTRFQTS